jgi:NADH-quinone oxidoreductase subunit L
MVCAWAAISGIPPFASFYSKDAILMAAYHQAPWIYWLGTVTAGITAFYVSRAMFLAFFGEYRGHAHPHESSAVMTVPLAILALLSLVGGFLFKVPAFLGPLFPPLAEGENPVLTAISVGDGLVGILIAYVLYVAKPGLADSLASSMKGLYTLVYNKYFVDEVYDATVVKPVVGGSREVLWKGIDVGVIDGIANGIGSRSKDIGGVLRLLQSGNIRSYAAWVLFGSVLLIVAMGLAGGAR